MQRPGKYPEEARERAVRLVQEHQQEYPSSWAAITSIAKRCGMTRIGYVPPAEYEASGYATLIPVAAGTQ